MSTLKFSSKLSKFLPAGLTTTPTSNTNWICRSSVFAKPRSSQAKKDKETVEACESVKDAANSVKEGAKSVKKAAQTVTNMTKDVTDKISETAGTVTEKAAEIIKEKIVGK